MEIYRDQIVPLQVPEPLLACLPAPLDPADPAPETQRAVSLLLTAFYVAWADCSGKLASIKALAKAGVPP